MTAFSFHSTMLLLCSSTLYAGRLFPLATMVSYSLREIFHDLSSLVILSLDKLPSKRWLTYAYFVILALRKMFRPCPILWCGTVLLWALWHFKKFSKDGRFLMAQSLPAPKRYALIAFDCLHSLKKIMFTTIIRGKELY